MIRRDGFLARWRTGARRLDGRSGPDFLYIGCQKAGSSWLYDQLSAHAGFWMPPVKELHYFDGYEAGVGVGNLAQRARNRRQQPTGRWFRRPTGATRFFAQVAAGDGGTLDLDWYASLFRWKGDRLSGDITPTYSTLSARTIGLIAAQFPELRYILFVRDPVARAWSEVSERHRNRGDPLPTDWPEMESFLTDRKVAARSYPSRIFARWSEHVGGGRIFVGFFDHLARSPDQLRGDVLRFLGAGSSPPAIEADFDRKRDVVRTPCPPELQRRLADWFADEMNACARVFGGPATAWPSQYGLDSTLA